MSEINSGTGAGLREFLDWAGSRGEVNSTTANAFKVAARKVLLLEGEPDSVDLRSIDVESLLDRFETRFRGEYTTGSMSTYKTRFRQAVALYLAWLDKDPSWKGIVRKRRSSSRTITKLATESRVEPGTATAESAGGHDVLSAGASSPPRLVKHHLPLRPDLLIQIELPVDLTVADAERVAAFVRSLAFAANTRPDSVGD